MKKGYFLVFLTAVISGISIFINKFGVAVINSNVFTFLKNLVVAVLLSGLLIIFKDWQKLKKLTKKHWFLLISIGLVGGSIPFLLFLRGLSLINAVQGSFWHKTMFIYVIILASIFLKEKIDKKFLLGGLLLLLGNLVLLNKLPIAINKGDVLVILATIFWAIENIISKYALRETEPRIVAWARMFFGSLFIFLFLITTNQLGLIGSLGFKQISWVLVSGILLLGYAITWYEGLKTVPVSQATVILILGLPITTFLSFLAGGKVGFQEILSGVLIILGMMIVLGLKEIWQLIKQTKKLFYAQ
jgi:drug/metabolite transporter (DMT)-like permease